MALRMAGPPSLATKQAQQTTIQQSQALSARSSLIPLKVNPLSSHKISNENTPSNYQITVDVAPSPLDFVNFFPWMCQKLGLEGKVYVIKLLQERYTSIYQQRSGKYKKVVKTTSDTNVESSVSAVGRIPSSLIKELFRDDGDIHIEAYHDANDRLVEICIKGCNIITQKHIKALTLCMPFHSVLIKMNVTRCSLFQEVIYEMGQLLPESNITELFLDDTQCNQGNYYTLLEYTSNLKRLSLNRCNINDAIVKELFSKLRAEACKSLQILEISSNLITDKGALIIGNTLRTNRVLIHLNLAGNRITDKGAAYILNSLMEFQLTDVEIMDKKKRNLNFIKRKMRVFESCYAEQLRLRQRQLMSLSSPQTKSSSKNLNQKKNIKTSLGGQKKKYVEVDINSIAAKETQQIMGGPFADVFDDEHVTCKDGKYFCEGNFILASLNLAYNNLTHLGMITIQNVLEYQASTQAANRDNKGLVRIVVDGNNICQKCEILDEILSYLIKKTTRRTETLLTKKSSMSTRRLTSRRTVMDTPIDVKTRKDKPGR